MQRFVTVQGHNGNGEGIGQYFIEQPALFQSIACLTQICVDQIESLLDGENSKPFGRYRQKLQGVTDGGDNECFFFGNLMESVHPKWWRLPG